MRLLKGLLRTSALCSSLSAALHGVILGALVAASLTTTAAAQPQVSPGEKVRVPVGDLVLWRCSASGPSSGQAVLEDVKFPLYQCEFGLSLDQDCYAGWGNLTFASASKGAMNLFVTMAAKIDPLYNSSTKLVEIQKIEVIIYESLPVFKSHLLLSSYDGALKMVPSGDSPKLSTLMAQLDSNLSFGFCHFSLIGR